MNNYQELVAEFKELMERGEKDQRKLAELAYLAIDELGHKPSEFAKDVGRQVDTVRKYRMAYVWEQENPDRDLDFADVLVLANMSEDRATAVQVLAGATGKPIGTVKSDTEAINIVQDFLTHNPDMLKEALKDDKARQAVASAAYKAAAEQVVEGAEGIVREAAGKPKSKPKPDPRGLKALEIERLKHDVARAARENGMLTNRWERDLDYLMPDMSTDELEFVFNELGRIIDRTSQLRLTVDAARKART
jgi:hypothetical protein